MVEKNNFKKLMISTKCAICDTLDNSTLLYKEKIPNVGIDRTVYTPRRDRDYYHYRLVRCKTCSLVRSDPILDNKRQEKLYQESLCPYSETSENYLLKKTYGKYIRKLIKDYKIKKNFYLDIGCANGFLLKKALELGFKNVKGIEPSDDAIKKANSNIKPYIMKGLFTRELFDENQFDLITFFQTFDHIPDPNSFLKDCFHVLKKGGFVLAINHNVEATSAKILKENSPIFDIGHAYLYNLKTMRKIFEKNGFQVFDVFSAKNIISLNYLIPHLPINQTFKNTLRKFFSVTRIGDIFFPFYLGNLCIIAKKPI